MTTVLAGLMQDHDGRNYFQVRDERGELTQVNAETEPKRLQSYRLSHLWKYMEDGETRQPYKCLSGCSVCKDSTLGREP